MPHYPESQGLYSYVLLGPRCPSPLCTHPCWLEDGFLQQCALSDLPHHLLPVPALHKGGASETRAPQDRKGSLPKAEEWPGGPPGCCPQPSPACLAQILVGTGSLQHR